MAETVAVTKFCAAFKNLNLTPCTSCRYCIEENECLKTILIPDMFAALNSREAFHGWNAKYYYLNFPLIEVLRTSARAGSLHGPALAIFFANHIPFLPAAERRSLSGSNEP